MPHASLAAFAAANDAAAATTKKLQKQAILAAYFQSLDEADLRRAVRFAGGYAFPATDERVLSVGGAIVHAAVLGLLDVEPGVFHDLVIRSGETGEALAKIWPAPPEGPAERPAPLAAAPAQSPEAPPRDEPREARPAQDAPSAGRRKSPRRTQALVAPEQPAAAPDQPAAAAEASQEVSRNAPDAPAPSSFRDPPPPDRVPLTLADLAAAFDALAATGNTQLKRELLAGVLARCATGREAAYVVKIISGDLRTGVQEGVLQAAIAQAFDKPLPDVQRAQLLVGDLDEVAALARAGALDAASFRLFHPIQFMLAAPQETAADAADTLAGQPFYCEDKLDGIRAQVHKDAGRIHIYTRTMDRTDESFPDVVSAVASLPGEFLLDGEIVPYAGGKVLPFANIQKRLGRKVLTEKILREHPCVFVAFDILFRDGELLMDRPLTDRRAALESLAAAAGVPPRAPLATEPDLTADAAAAAPPTGEHASSEAAVPVPPARSDVPLPPLLVSAATLVTTADEIAAAFDAARARRNEGLILKNPASPYAPGRRGKLWLKLKTTLPTFDCVVTAAEYGHGKRRQSLSDYTFAVWDRDPADPGAALVNVGKAFSGVTDEEIRQLTKLFLGIALDATGRVRRVKPQVVLEIAADQIQKSARHASGYALRFPRIKRVRWDKRPEDADRLARIAELYESAHNFGRTDAAGEAAEVPAPPAAEPTLFDGM